MEHRVKQRSADWNKLRQNILLDASQFADAVGLGKGKPFDFFKTQIEGESKSTEENDSSNSEKQVMLRRQMESVIQEAYELLTGLRVQESGFWVPEEDNPMHGLIGASPDAVVVDGKDASCVFGLVKFPTPVSNMCGKTEENLDGISRPLMVQIQGQMAVCGAPWCDVMAVCSKTKDLMLKRVFFQSSYWQPISSRLKHFCYALQEVEMMQEVGREVYSGAMTKRIQHLSTQDTLFPAEDTIIVQNLLTQPAPQMFRGPSRKLLSYHILVGDSYVLPSSLNRYGHDLLAKVDAELTHKTPNLGTNTSFAIDDKEEGEIHHRVFREIQVQSPESPETIFKEVVSDVFEGKDVDMEPDNTIQIAPSNLAMSASQVSAESDIGHADSNIRDTCSTIQDTHITTKSQPNPDLSTSTTTQMALTSPSTNQVNKPRTESPPFRKLSRIYTNQNSGAKKGTMSKHLLRSSVPGKSPQLHAPEAEAGTRSAQRGPVSKNVSKGGASGNAPRAGQSPRAVAPRNLQRGALSKTGPRAACPAPCVRPPLVSQSSSATASQSSSATAGAPASTVCSASLISSSAGTTDLTAAKTSTSSVVTTNSSQQARQNVLSARDEWELSARKKQVSKQVPDIVVTTPSVVMKQAQSSSSQVPSKQTSASAVDHQTSNRRSEEPEGNVRKEKPSERENVLQNAEMHKNDSPASVPCLASQSGSRPSDLTDQNTDTVAEDLSIKRTVQQSADHFVQQSQEPTKSQQKPFSTFQQGHKRPYTSHNLVPEVDSKKFLFSKSDKQSDDDGMTSATLERKSIHRPWQSYGKAFELNQNMMQRLEDSDKRRDFGHFDKTQDSVARSFDMDDQHIRGRGHLEMGHDRPQRMEQQRMQHLEERSGSQIRSLLERDRPGALPMVHDYDHRDHVVSEDFHRNQNIGQQNLRGNLGSAYDNFRHFPLDLSERRGVQESFDRDLFSANRNNIRGRDEGRLTMESEMWRGQFQRQLPQQMPPQSVWQQLQSRSDILGLRNTVRNSWPRGQALSLEARRTMQLQSQLLDHRFPGPEGRDLRLRGPAVDLRGDNVIQNQFSRNFPRRPFNF